MRYDPKAYSENVIFIPPPHHAAFQGMGGVRAMHFTAMRAPHIKGFDCRLGDPATFAANQTNRAAAALALGIDPQRLLTTKQSEASVMIVARGWNMNMRPKAHAMVIARNDIHAIGVLTNDCAPVLLADAENRVAAAVHLGWREAARDLLERAVDNMVCLGARRDQIMASIGPCAGVERTYEVGPDFASLPPNNDPAIADFLTRHDNKIYFAFQDYAAHRLQRCGLAAEHISCVRVDTIADPSCYSLRRDGPGQGSMLSAIRLVQPAPM